MKNIQFNLLLALLAVLSFSCKDKIEETYKVQEPEYMSYEDLRSSFKVSEAEDIIQPGKIYFKDDHVFINEYMEGIHVIDNSNPSSPQVLKFIEIPGNVDLAIRGNILYADSYVDLLAIDISDLNNIVEVKRIENAFPYMLPPVEDGVIEEVDENKGVVRKWKTVDKTIEVERQQPDYLYYEVWTDNMVRNVDFALAETSGPAPTNGTGGSMARFTLYDHYLYAVDFSTLRLFSVEDTDDPTLMREENIGWNIETIFPYEDKLFIGTQTGMVIFSISDPEQPEYISTFWHASSCDPVVVEGNYAYVTLRAGNLCGDNQSQLDVIDISNIYNPVLKKEYPMDEPYGLGIDDSILFVCDGSSGLKIYNASDPLAIDQHLLKIYPDIDAYDVIPLGDILLLIGIDGFYQYDYSDLENIQLLSHIPIYQQ